MLRKVIAATLFGLLALALWAQTALADQNPAAVTSPNASVTMWREHTAPLVPGAVLTDHVFVKNETGRTLERIQVRQYWSSPSLTYIGWSGVGANDGSWTLKTEDVNHFVATYAPDMGIEPGGVGEMIFVVQAKDAALWPVFPAPAQVQADHTAVLVDDGAAKQLLSALQPQALLSSFVNLQVSAGSNSLNVHRVAGALKAQVLSVQLKTPFAVTYVAKHNWPQTTQYGGEANSCDTQVAVNETTGAISVRLGDCALNAQYPFGGGGKGEAIPEGFARPAWKATPGKELTLDLGQLGVQLKLPPGQGIEVTYFDPDEVTEQIWFNGQEWLRAPLVPGQISRFFSVQNFHTVKVDRSGGTVTLAQFPYRTVPTSPPARAR